MDAHQCWRCEAETESLFCRYCNTLQPPAPDYYRFFGLQPKLSLDPSELQQLFYTLSRQVHPDRYGRATPEEQKYSLEATSILNDGYRILRDPVQRAELVLKANGFDIGEQRGKDVPPELLEEVFELNMALDELRSGDEDAREPLSESLDKFLSMLGDIDRQLEAEFQRHDATPGAEARREVLASIRGILNRRRYIRNLVTEVEKVLAPA